MRFAEFRDLGLKYNLAIKFPHRVRREHWLFCKRLTLADVVGGDQNMVLRSGMNAPAEMTSFWKKYPGIGVS